MRSFFKKWGGWGLKFLFSAVLVGFLLQKYDLRATWDETSEVRSGMLALGGLLCFGVIFCNAWRWWLLIKTVSPGACPSFRDIFAVNYAGQFSTLFLPMTVGSDAVKVVCLKRLGAALTETVSNVTIDRLLSYLTLVYAALVMMPWAWKTEALRMPLMLFALIGFLGTLFLFAVSFIRKIPEGKDAAPLWKWVLRLSRDLHALFSSPGKGIAIVALGVFSHVLFSLMFYVLGRGLGIDIGLTDCLVFIPAVVLMIMLPISISGWGVREQAMVTAFSLTGMAEPQALLLSVVGGGVVTLMSLPGLFSWQSLKKKEAGEP